MTTNDTERETINKFIGFVRAVSALNDDEIRLLLTNIANERPDLFEVLSQASNKRAITEIKKMAIHFGSHHEGK